jgi:excisionase family DNA binding protein
VNKRRAVKDSGAYPSGGASGELGKALASHPVVVKPVTGGSFTDSDGAPGWVRPVRGGRRGKDADDEFPALYLRVNEAGQMLRLSRAAVYRLIASGELVSCRVGPHLRIPVSSVEKFARDVMKETA